MVCMPNTHRFFRTVPRTKQTIWPTITYDNMDLMHVKTVPVIGFTARRPSIENKAQLARVHMQEDVAARSNRAKWSVYLWAHVVTLDSTGLLAPRAGYNDARVRISHSA